MRYLMRDRTGRAVEPSWAFGKPVVYVQPDVRDLADNDSELCSRRTDCELRDGHGSGCATGVRIQYQSLQSIDS